MASIPGVAVPDRAHRLPQTHLAGLPGATLTAPGPEFRLRVTPLDGTANASDGQGGAFDDSGRAQARVTLLVKYRAKGGVIVSLRAGDRIQVTAKEPSLSGVYEVVKPLAPIRAQPKNIGFTGEAEKVSLLYSHVATLTDMGDTTIATIPMSLYISADERAVQTGVVQDWSGEAPYEYLDELSAVNRVLHVDGKRLKIVSALPHKTIPRVALRLREARSA